MMLVVGGAHSGKRTFVREKLGFAADDFVDAAQLAEGVVPAVFAGRVAYRAEELVRTLDADRALERLIGFDAVILTLVGSGVVPMRAEDAQWRERAGRLGCALAARADVVVRMTCGIPQVIKGNLADRGLYVTGFIGTVLNLTSFDFIYGTGYIHGNRSDFWVRHEAFRTEEFTKAANHTHHVRRCYADVKVEPAAFDLVSELFSTNKVSTCILSFLSFCTAGKNKNSLGFTSTMGQNQSTADLLVSILRIDTEANGAFNSAVEFGDGSLFNQFNSFFRSICLASFDQLCSIGILLTSFSHCTFSS